MLSILRRRLGISAEYARAAASGYAATAINIIAQIALVPLYLSHLGMESFGILMIVTAAINYSSIGTTWLAGGTTRIIGEFAATEKMDDVYHAYFTAKIVNVGYAVVIGVVILSLSFITNAGVHFSSIIPWAILYLVALFDLGTDRLALSAMRRQGVSNLIGVLNTIIAFFATVVVLDYGGGVEHVFGAMTCGTVAARLFSLWYWHDSRLFKGASTPDRSVIRKLLKRLLSRMGLGYAIYGFILLSLQQADPLILSWLGGPEVVASYVLVWKAADVSIQLIWRLPEYLQPKIIHLDAQGKTEELRELYHRSLKSVLIISLLVAVLYASLGHLVLKAWVGVEYAPTDPVTYLLAGGAIFWIATARVPTVFAYARVRLKRLVLTSMIELSGKLSVTIALFPVLHELAPLAAMNIVYALGVFPAYLYIVAKDATGVCDKTS